jgi:hypothetical protein
VPAQVLALGQALGALPHVSWEMFLYRAVQEFKASTMKEPELLVAIMRYMVG